MLVMVMLLTSWFIWSMLYGDCLVLCYHQRRRPCSHLKLQRGMPVARLMGIKICFNVCYFIYFNHSWRLKEKKSSYSLSELREEGFYHEFSPRRVFCISRSKWMSIQSDKTIVYCLIPLLRIASFMAMILCRGVGKL